MPDRLPSLIVLAGFWVPPAAAGWVAAGTLKQRRRRDTIVAIYGALGVFVLFYALLWFLFNLSRMPPYVPGASADPAVATPQAVNALLVVAGALVLPGSALACAVAFRRRARELRFGRD
jgi:hypothetical protein